MSDTEFKSSGWLSSLQRAADSVLGLVQNRFELFVVEFQEEKLRAINLLIWLGVVLVLGAGGLLVGLGTLALLAWKWAHFRGLIGLTLILLVAAAGVFWGIRRQLRQGPRPFADTLAEFKKDREWLRPKH